MIEQWRDFGSGTEANTSTPDSAPTSSSFGNEVEWEDEPDGVDESTVKGVDGDIEAASDGGPPGEAVVAGVALGQSAAPRILVKTSFTLTEVRCILSSLQILLVQPPLSSR